MRTFSGAGAYTVLRRDRFACWLCNLILRRITSEWYRDMIGGSILYGLRAAASLGPRR